MRKLLIDKREHPTRQKKVTDAIPGAECTMIEVGDYVWVEDDKVICAVEWKTYADLCQSISNGHMESQLHDMDQYETPFLFIVGKHTIPRHCPLGADAIFGYLTSACIHHKVKILHFDTEGQAIRQLSRIPDKMTTRPSMPLPKRHLRMDNPNDEMYLSVPGIGKKSLPKYRDYRFGEFISLVKSGNEPFKIPDRVRNFLIRL